MAGLKQSFRPVSVSFKICINSVRNIDLISVIFDRLILLFQGKEGPQQFDIFPYIGRCALDIICGK